MKLFLFSLPYVLLAIWFAFSCYYVYRAYKKPDEVNPYLFDSIPQVFPTIGILGTFIGIAYGLWYFDVNNIEGSIPELLNGLKTAFLASIGGILLLIVFSNLTAMVKKKNDTERVSPEAVAMQQMVALMTDMRDSQQATLPEMRAVKDEIIKLGDRLQHMNSEMTQAVINELYDALNSLIEDFKVSMAGARTELETLTAKLGHTGEVLTEVTPRLQELATKLNDSFEEIKQVIKQLSPANIFPAKLQQQMEDINTLLLSLVKARSMSEQQIRDISTIESKVSTMYIQMQNGLCKYPRFLT